MLPDVVGDTGMSPPHRQPAATGLARRGRPLFTIGTDKHTSYLVAFDASDEGQRLRSSSSFVGVLSPEERLEILAACEQRATV